MKSPGNQLLHLFLNFFVYFLRIISSLKYIGDLRYPKHLNTKNIYLKIVQYSS